MKFIEADVEQETHHTPIIAALSGVIEDNLCTLRWLWPAGVQAVYIHKLLQQGLSFIRRMSIKQTTAITIESMASVGSFTPSMLV